MRFLADDVMPVECAGCAYRAGTEANRDELTTLTRELCEMGRVPFYCHANMVDDALPKEAKRLCHGFMGVMLRQTIVNAEPPQWKRLLAEEALRLMEEAEDQAKHGEPEATKDEVMRTLLSRVERRVQRDNGPTNEHERRTR